MYLQRAVSRGEPRHFPRNVELGLGVESGYIHRHLIDSEPAGLLLYGEIDRHVGRIGQQVPIARHRSIFIVRLTYGDGKQWPCDHLAAAPALRHGLHSLLAQLCALADQAVQEGERDEQHHRHHRDRDTLEQGRTRADLHSESPYEVRAA